MTPALDLLKNVGLYISSEFFNFQDELCRLTQLTG